MNKKNEIEDVNDKKFSDLYNKMCELSKINTVVSMALQNKKTETIILDKLNNEEQAIDYGINSINKKVLLNQKKYSNIIEEKTKLLDEYKGSLELLGKSIDNSLNQEYIKVIEQDLFQLEKFLDIYKLRKLEIKAKAKVDNSDDEIAEQIYSIEDELNKSDAKLRRLKTNINSKIKEKDQELFSAIETKEKAIQTNIKGPKMISNAKKFFFGKINPSKLIERNIYSGLRERIKLFKDEKLSKIKKSNKNETKKLIKSIDELVNNTKKNIKLL